MDVSNSCFAYLKLKYTCPHCDQKLTMCYAPPVHVGDGLGWGSEILFICLNDDCSLFQNGWDYIEQQYGHNGSYRYMRLPNSNENNNMMVGSKDAFKGSIVDIEMLKSQNERYQKEKEAIRSLDTCVEDKKLDPVLFLLLDKHADKAVRKRAVKLLVELNDLSCIEPLRNFDFRDTHLEQDVNMAIITILKEHFQRECPHCAELIKARAKVCKHCQQSI